MTIKPIAILTSCALISGSIMAQTVVNDSISSAYGTVKYIYKDKVVTTDSIGNAPNGLVKDPEHDQNHITTNDSHTPEGTAIEEDSIKSEQLKEVVVEAKYSNLGAQVSTFIPTSTQKNASIDATDLLNRMAIPQLQMALGERITTIAGKPVSIFIDYMPATKEDLVGMKTIDVKRVEYYDFPSDTRFQGKPHVINFIMYRYEYGGYSKPYLERCFGARTAQWAVFNRLQYKRMTFDFALNGSYKDQDRVGADITETFRLPQEDGTVKVIDKTSSMKSGQLKQKDHYAYFKAKYASENFNMQHNLILNLKRRPRYDQSGSATYSDPLYDATSYESESSNRASSIKYSSYIYYQLNETNSFGFDPEYIYSHTNTSSLYYEQPSQKFYNRARDTTHEFMLPVNYNHYFGHWGQLHLHFRNYFSCSDTEYFGTVQSKDHSKQLDLVTGARYTLSKGKFYGFIGAGYYWNRTTYASIKVKSNAPWADFSLQYSPNDKQSALVEYHHMSSSPSPNYFSENVIQKDPLMSYTGNPNLEPYQTHDLTLSYNLAPNNRYSLSTYGYMSIVSNRHLEQYIATPTGIIRRVVQEGVEDYRSYSYGVTATARYLKNNLQLRVSVYGSTWYDNQPGNQSRTKFFYYIQANYYLGRWNFGALFYSRRTTEDGFTNSKVITSRPTYYLSAGWSNSIWNIRCTVYNFAKWNYRSNITTIRSQSYDYLSQAYSQGDHFYIKLTASYIFSFGKKVERGSESFQKSAVSSGILK